MAGLSVQSSFLLKLILLILPVFVSSVPTLEPVPQNVEPSALIPLVQVVSNYTCTLGKGAYWDEANHLLYYVDSLYGEYIKFNPANSSITTIRVADDVAFILPQKDEPNTFVVSEANDVLTLNWDTKQLTLLGTLSPDLNGKEVIQDGKRDPRGRLLISSVRNNIFGTPVVDGGSLWYFDGTEFVKLSEGYSIPSGMVWSRDGTQLYIEDSLGRQIYVLDYDLEAGTPIGTKRLLVDCGESNEYGSLEYPDGMHIDEEGFLWVCMFQGGRIVKIDVNTGRVVDQVTLPTGDPSSLVPGEYEGRSGYYVTTAIPLINTKPDDGKLLHFSYVEQK